MKPFAILLLGTLTATAVTYTNPPPLLLRATTNDFANLPYGEQPPIVGPTYRITSPEADWVYGIDGAVSAEFCGLILTHTGYAGCDYYTVDQFNEPLDRQVCISVNGKVAGIYRAGYFGSDGHGAIEFTPLSGEVVAFVVLDNLVTCPPPPPTLAISHLDGRHRITVTLDGAPGQSYTLRGASDLGGPWSVLTGGTLSAEGQAGYAETAGERRFYRAE